MTDNNTRSLMAAADLDRITVELDVAREDLALLERLKSAHDRVNRLTTEREKAIKERDRALAAEAKAVKAKRFAGITDLRVSETHTGEHVLRSSWTIQWTKPAWDGRATLPRQHSCEGFGGLPTDVFDYLIEERSDLIPAKIMALDPSDARKAFHRYFLGLRRGCLIG
jgi:hypothetical protein